MSEKLKPCPFCSTEDVKLGHYGSDCFYITCDGCGTDGPASDTQEGAGEAWNRRHQEQDQSSTFERCMK